MEINPYQPPQATDEPTSPPGPMSYGRQMHRLAVLFWQTSTVFLVAQCNTHDQRFSVVFCCMGMILGAAAVICGYVSMDYAPRSGMLIVATGMFLTVLPPFFLTA